MPPQPDDRPLTRRDLFRDASAGLAGIALAWLCSEEARAGSPTHFPPRVKRVVQIFATGGVSHVDTFDYKPDLARHAGQELTGKGKIDPFFGQPGRLLPSPFRFRQHGRSGLWVSDLLPHLATCVDDITFIHSMVGKTGVHSTSTLLQATGFVLPGFPGMGAWVSYGLGSLNDNLPTFVVMPDHRGFPSNGQKNWDSAFLSARYQGTIIQPESENPIADLFPNKNDFVTKPGNEAGLALLNRLNRDHAAERPADSRLEARIRSYELAAKMQLAAPEALDLSKEPGHILRMYGLDHGQKTWPKEINAGEETDYFGRKCLVARRLLERGVRFVQIWMGCDNGFPRRNWDSHEDIFRDHGPLGIAMARGCAALIKDLKQRGMLDGTIVHWTTEFGRMPCAQTGKGRDHNPFCFTHWLAGGGIKPGIAYGPSDEWGYKPADRNRPTQVYDVHATMLKLLGIEHTKLTFRHNGIDRRLTDVHGQVIEPILA